MISLQDELKIFKKQTINRYYNDALGLVKDNNISKAIELMERSLKDISEDVETLNLMGICQYMLCNFDKASLYWNKSLMADNGSNRARYYLEFLNSDKYKSFIEYYDLSIRYIDKFKYKDAIELLLEINRTNKDLIEPYALIGNCYYALQEYELAKQYLEQALTKDIDNLKYLRYLNKINSKISLSSKRTKNKNNNWNYKLSMSLIVLIIVIISLVFYQKYNKDIKALSSELNKRKSENNKLEEQLEDEKHKNNKNQKSKDEEVENDIVNKDLSFSGSEAEIFQNALEGFTNKQYSKSIDKFQYLINTAQNEDLVAESIYFIAVSFEKEKEYDKAEEYYNSYIDKYEDRSYYDDSLYNYGLMLFEKGDIEDSKKILYKLKKEEPDSEFINSRVKEVLEKS